MASDEQIRLNVVEVPLSDKAEETDTKDTIEEQPDIRGDRLNILLLVTLYMMTAVPYGLTSTIPMILQKRGASYSTQAKFSLVMWPYTLKLLWAPIVDSYFSSKLRSRASLLVPIQYLVGFVIITMSFHIDGWLGDSKTDANIFILCCVFFGLATILSTQDIIVDGWSLTMLKRRNAGHTSLCINVGNSIGFYFGYALLVSLESAEFCNTYLRTVPQDKGIWSIAGLLDQK